MNAAHMYAEAETTKAVTATKTQTILEVDEKVLPALLLELILLAFDEEVPPTLLLVSEVTDMPLS